MAAVAHLTKPVQELPNDADAHNMLGYSYRKTGNFDKSMEHYQRALKIDANHRSAHEYLGELYLDLNQLGNAEKQLAALKRACPFLGKCGEYDEKHKAPIGWVPVEPVVANLLCISVGSAAPNPKTARLFVDFATSKEGQTIVSQKFQRVPAHMDVESNPPSLTRGIKFWPSNPELGEKSITTANCFGKFSA